MDETDDMESASDNIGNTIRAIRQIQDITAKELADRCDCSRSWVWALERGETENPGVRTVEKIARGLNMRLSEFIRKAEEFQDFAGVSTSTSEESSD